jgi:hypothetical protein
METKPKPKAADPGFAPVDVQTRPHGSPLVATRAPQPQEEREPDREFDPLRFGVTELPPGMRQNLIATQLPLVPADQLFDTHPPNRPIPSTDRRRAPDARDSLPAIDAPDSVKIPLRSWRTLVIAVVAVIIAGIGVVLVMASPNEPRSSTPPAPSRAIAAPITPQSSVKAPTRSIAPPPNTSPSIPDAPRPVLKPKAPEPARTPDSKPAVNLSRPRQDPVPTPRPSSAPVTTSKPSGLDAAEFPKPD